MDDELRKKIDEVQNGLKRKIEGIEKIVNRHDKIVWVVSIVAVIFGITGAFGVQAISSMNKKLTETENNITVIASKVDKVKEEFSIYVDSQKEEISKYGRQEEAKLEQKAKQIINDIKNSIQEGEGIIKIGNKQIVWGTVDATNHSNPSYRNFSISFSESFIEKPSITFGFIAGGNPSQGIAVRQLNNFDENGVSGQLNIHMGQLKRGFPVKVSYISIGNYR